jgi:hypothetical protein
MYDREVREFKSFFKKMIIKSFEMWAGLEGKFV